MIRDPFTAVIDYWFDFTIKLWLSSYYTPYFLAGKTTC